MRQGVQNAPLIDTAVERRMADDVRAARNQPEAQVRQDQFTGVTRGARGAMATDMALGLLQGIDEAHDHAVSLLYISM